jgi:hypothetical protein
MKTRMGFVSNSSSASFVIGKSKLTPEQIEKIKNYKEVAYELGDYANIKPKEWEKDSRFGPCGKFGWIDGWWQIDEKKDYIKGYTNMDNFDFHAFLLAIGVKEEDIDWDGHDGGWKPDEE